MDEQLYRLDLLEQEKHMQTLPWYRFMLDVFTRDNVLVPVERCEHGKIDRHLICTCGQCHSGMPEDEWCEGAKL